MAVHLVLLAGGRGTRFWPLSRRSRPKQLLPLLTDESLLRDTWRRVAPLGTPERTWVITSAELLDACRREIPEIPHANFIGEPCGRDTAPAMMLATVLAEAGDPEAVLAFFPSDHHIEDAAALRRASARLLAEASAGESLLTLGIRPDRAETGYGYIEVAEETRSVGDEILSVSAFKEKPCLADAEAYLAGGRHFWNSGMFFFSAGALRRESLKQAPELWRALAPLGVDHGPQAMHEAYGRLPSLSFDKAIMEKAESVRVLPADFSWNDVGHWLALGDELPDREGNRVLGDLLAIESENNIVLNREGLTALLGVRDLVVVRAGNALLVCHRDKAQALRDVVARLEQENRSEYL